MLLGPHAGAGLATRGGPGRRCGRRWRCGEGRRSPTRATARFAAAAVARLEELHLGALENWIDADLATGLNGNVLSLRVTSPSSNGADYSSKEGAAPPQLAVTVQ